MGPKGFTGHSAGWGVAEYHTDVEGKNVWEWWARFDDLIEEGFEPTWAQSVGAAKKAYTVLEKNSPAPVSSEEEIFIEWENEGGAV